MNEITENYTRIRDKKGLTDYGVSKKSGLVMHTVYRFRDNPESARYETIKKIAEALECKVSDLIG